MARKKNTRKRISRPKFNVFNTAQAVVLGNVVTQGMFNANMWEFFSGRTGGASFYNGNQTDNVITLPEMLGFDQMGFRSGQPVVYKSIDAGFQSEKIIQNLKDNGFMMSAQLLLVPVGFKVLKKVSSPVRREAGKMLKYAGITGVTV